jgi:hypothetical protein
MSSRNPESESFGRRDAENQWLREENLCLRRLLAAHGIAVPPSASEDVELARERVRQPDRHIFRYLLHLLLSR